MSDKNGQTRRFRIHFYGAVQGVGFRPTIYRLAKSLGVKGSVRNTTEGVIVEIEGDVHAEEFVDHVKSNLPPLAKLTGVEWHELEPVGYDDFIIEKSSHGNEVQALVLPDAAICEDCKRELFDPSDRRYRYPFINCTNCGPRFTIIKALPYDRPNTTMAVFKMCPECEAEYHDPSSRRFHAQPNCCAVCGPRLFLIGPEGEVEGDQIKLTAKAILEGKVVAIKGLGGYHLACDATNDEAVKKLRMRKRRYNKPFALMARMADIERICRLSESERALLQSTAAPIVLLEPKSDGMISQFVAPGQKKLGFMIPYTPLHLLLMEELKRPIVLTSANPTGEPIIFRDETNRLLEFADLVLTHNRDIYIRADDSVDMVFRGARYPVRRSRGYAPLPVRLPVDFRRTLLAVGPMMRTTFTLLIGRNAFLSQHIGDTDTLAGLQAEIEAVNHFINLFQVSKVDIVAIDKHPLYPNRSIADEFPDAEVIEVQHHRAHIAGVMAEHGLTGEVIGVAMDGTGYGDDGAVWGGEFFAGEVHDLKRVGHLRYVFLPGGDSSIRHIWKFALSILYELGEEPSMFEEKFGNDYRMLLGAIKNRFAGVMTSSAGRLFDAASYLLGVCEENTFDGEAPMRLEAAAVPADGRYGFEVHDDGNSYVLDMLPAFREMLQDGEDVSFKAFKFHRTLADGIVKVVRRIAADTGIKRVALSGGVFQNLTLLEMVVSSLERRGFDVLIHREVPPNDGGLSLGMAMLAAMQ